MQQSLFATFVNQAQTEDSPIIADLTALLHETPFTVIDVETTGLNAKKNALTEITAITYVNGIEKDMFTTLVRPTEPISPEVQAITGISNEMVQNAPPLITVLSDLCGFVGSAPIIVGHNVGFDIKFISEKIEACGLPNFADRFDLKRAFCTKALAMKVMPGLPSYEGIVVATQCDVLNLNPHRAESDVRMSAGILFHLIARLKGQSAAMLTVQDLLTYQGALS